MNKLLKFKKRFFIILGLVLLLLGTSTTWVFAQAVYGDGTIYACVNTSDGTVRIVSNSTSCKRSERLLSWNIMGPKGDKGDPGPAGPQGPAGKDGATGPTGPAGADGLACWDLNGDDIRDAVEDTNRDGKWDAADCKGEQGLQGLRGEQGAQGLVGPRGEQGLPGQAGSQGPAGSQGETGSQGAAGPAGENGLNCWDLNGNGKEDLEEDLNRDRNFDTRDCKGQQGEAGPEGPVGPKGLQGDVGPTGPQGPIGLTGAAGATGPQGEPGPAGAGIFTLEDLNGIPCQLENSVEGVVVLALDPNTGNAIITCIPAVTYTLTVSSGSLHGGTVISNPAGISCGNGGSCSYSFPAGTTISLTSTEGDYGESFAGWGGACSGTGPCQVIMNENKTVTAEYSIWRYIRLYIGDPTYSGVYVTTTYSNNEFTCNTANSNGIDCEYRIQVGETVTFVAHPNSSSRFSYWGDRGEGLCSWETSNTCTVTIEENDPLSMLLIAWFTSND